MSLQVLALAIQVVSSLALLVFRWPDSVLEFSLDHLAVRSLILGWQADESCRPLSKAEKLLLGGWQKVRDWLMVSTRLMIVGPREKGVLKASLGPCSMLLLYQKTIHQSRLRKQKLALM